MACPCKRDHVFIGLDFGTTRCGAVVTCADVCTEHSYFQVQHEIRVPKFLARFVTRGHKIEMVRTDQNDPNVSGVKNAKLEILFNGDPERFVKRGDYHQIKSWVEGDWQRSGGAGLPAEYFGSAIKTLYDLAWKDLKMPHISKESITTVVTFPLLTGAIKDTLKRGLDYSNISSRCQDVQVSEESHAALAGLLREYPEIGREALAANESIIVADCGGITLDIAAFRPFDPKCGGAPAAASISRLGGGLWVDRNFEKLVDQKLDELKVQISQLGDEEVDNEEADEVRSELIRLWHTSIKENPPFQRVFLTGGLGCSQAVRELVPRILNAKIADGKPPMRVENTEDPPLLWNAVAMGAAHCFDRTIPVHRPTWRPFAETPESDEMMG
ncbi:unnamed protein product [Clonostachys chloroleuca]|uniref:Actin-like ATPase domain-containing protein n=1 Tax=Clonostachys chloroleuca TaxID=1926264 RepID=A0AA35M8J0_9HYPO|nr:unnamed protein product [Clonostachys chloroleuca]